MLPSPDEYLGISVVLWCYYNTQLLRSKCLALLWPVCHPSGASVDASALPAYWDTMTSGGAANTDGTEQWIKPVVVKMCKWCACIFTLHLHISHVSNWNTVIIWGGVVVLWHLILILVVNYLFTYGIRSGNINPANLYFLFIYFFIQSIGLYYIEFSTVYTGYI